MSKDERELDGCCTRCSDECWKSWRWFGLEESGNKYVLDVARTFGPRDTFSLCFKLFFTALTVFTLAYDIHENPVKSFYMAFVSHWALCFAAVYSVLSLLNSMFRPRQPSNPADPPSLMVRLTWALFVVSAFFQIMVTAMFWYLEYDYSEGTSGLSYLSVMLHGGIALLLLMEGLAVNRIPVRFKHIYFCMALLVCYVLWTVLHAYLDIGNPITSSSAQSENSSTNTTNTTTMEEETTNDDIIYEAVQWKDDLTNTLITIAIVSLGMGPCVFTILWLVSLYSCLCSCNGSNRRYVIEVNTSDVTKNVNFYEDP